MAKITSITGIAHVIGRLKASQAFLGSKFEKGLKAGGLFLQRESQKIVPVDTGILRGGARTRKVSGKGLTSDVVVSYQADYATYVHEDLTMKHKPGKVAKFLEMPARQKRKEIFKIIANETLK